jgi:hypothetical protein
MTIKKAGPTLRLLKPLPVVITMIGIGLVYLLHTERAETTQFSANARTDSRLTRSHHRQLSRIHTRARAMKAKTHGGFGGGCFGATEEEARDKLIQKISEEDPSGWDPTMDYSSLLPSAGSYVCTEGLSEEEERGISEALNTTTQIKPQLSLVVNVENAPEPEAGHRIVEAYLGRDRYVEHMANCLKKTKSHQSNINTHLDQTMAQLLRLSPEQQKALEAIQGRLRALNSLPPIQAIDERGGLVTLDERQNIEADQDLRELLSIAELGFSILTDDQAHAYRKLATDTAYAEVFSQYNLTHSFLPIPEEIRELIKRTDHMMEEMRMLMQAQGEETPSHD